MWKHATQRTDATGAVQYGQCRASSSTAAPHARQLYAAISNVRRVASQVDECRRTRTRATRAAHGHVLAKRTRETAALAEVVATALGRTTIESHEERSGA